VRAAKRDQLADAQLNESELGTEQEGLVTTYYGTQVVVEATSGELVGRTSALPFSQQSGFTGAGHTPISLFIPVYSSWKILKNSL